jgi:glycosyltransferase involved in cell wall biosynthesis
MVGGAIEYVALVTGYGALLFVVAALYGLAWLFATRVRLLADRELRAALAAAGRQKARRYSWSEVARRVLSVYTNAERGTRSAEQRGFDVVRTA